jgi:hypothetical protein
MSFEVHIYRVTIIETYIPVSIIFIIGFVAFYYNRHHYKSVYMLKSNFYPLLQNLFSWGFISCYVFMAANYYFASKQESEFKFAIKEKGTMPKGAPLITFNYFNFKKELVFKVIDANKVETADSVIINVSKGGLGFDILSDYDVYK